MFLNDRKISTLNTRAFKENGKYVITVGSISKDKSMFNVEFMGYKFDVVYGEFSPYLTECNEYLKEAKKYTANDNQEKMIGKYIEHFETGDIEVHKDS